ncbi:MAG: BatA and WFA domain-containing protein [Armatimonadetes bacterium]|nr:BatA and WFA domain-containing protein [Armatimonadota bacterium]
MSWISPFAFLWLAPILAAIVALYLLKLKRKEVRVPSVMLWQRAVEDMQANAPFQRLRPSLLLLLQVIAAMLLVGALAQPFVRAAADPGSDLALILDGSASMKATDVPGTRFEEAKRQALRIVENLAPRDRVMVVFCGARTRQVAPLGADRAALARLIRELKADDAGADLREGILLAASLLAGPGPSRIVVLSDGAADPLGELSLGKSKLDFIRVGKRSENVAVTALDLHARSAGTGGARLDAFVSMRNTGASPRSFALELYRDGSLADVREARLGPGEEKAQVFAGLGGVKEAVSVRLDVKDDLAADNEAFLPVRPPSRVRVLLVTPGNLFLERALAALPAAEVTKTAAAPPADDRGYDVHVYDRIAPTVQPTAGVMLIGTAAPFGPAGLGRTLPHPQIVDWRQDSPLTRYVDLSAVAIEAGRLLTPKPWTVPLAETAEGSLMAAGERDGRRSLQVGFDLLRSDFPLRVGFPIFLANAVTWLAPAAGYGPGLSVRAGEEVALTLPPEAGSVRITGPVSATGTPVPGAGEGAVLPVEGGRAVLGGSDAVGLYTAVLSRGQPVRFAVNLFNRRESDLTPGDLRLRADGRAVSVTPGLSGRRELWRYALLAALALLLLEWHEYHARLLSSLGRVRGLRFRRRPGTEGRDFR